MRKQLRIRKDGEPYEPRKASIPDEREIQMINSEIFLPPVKQQKGKK